MRVLSLFSGCGGFDLGFIQNGFEIVWANDNDKRACMTYKVNIGNHIVCGDIRQISSEEMPNDIDVVIGGFPCQGFSISNTNRSVDDKRNFLYLEMLRVIRDKKPRFFVAENVKGILSLGNGKVIEKIVNDFSNLGYNVKYHLVNSKDYGVPQNRERVFIIGSLDTNITFPKPTTKKHISVRTAIGYLENIRCRDLPFMLDKKPIYNHVAYTNVKDTFVTRKHKVDQAIICDFLRENRRYSCAKIDAHFGYKDTSSHWFRKDKWGSLPSPEQWIILKELLRFDDTYDKVMTETMVKQITFDQHNRISHYDKPSDTITASSPQIHYNKHRRLSVRECAILQSFPDNFQFHGSITSMHRQIGNAVPPKLAFAIAKAIKEH